MITFQQFRSLSFESKLVEMSEHAVSLDIFLTRDDEEIALFSLNDFYVELYVKRFTDDIIKISSFKSLSRLNAYLSKVNIEEVKSYLLN